MAGFWTSPRLYAEFLKRTGLSLEDAEFIAERWARTLGPSGREVMELLGPYHSATLSFTVKPPAANVDALARQAFFWRPTSAVVPKTGGSLRGLLGDERGCVRDVIDDAFHAEMLQHLGSARWTELWETVQQCCIRRERLSRLVLDGIREGGLRKVLEDDLWHCITSGVQLTLFFAAGFLLAGDRQRDFTPLLDIWRSGNLPVGFAPDGTTLVVLCAGVPAASAP